MFSSAIADAGAGANQAINNALNLFPSTSTPPSTQDKLRRLLYVHTSNARGPTAIQSALAYSLYDDGAQYMSTLELNRAASYTFGHRNSYGQHGTTLNDVGGGTRGESVADEMWELTLDLTLGKFVQHSVMALTKTLHLIGHVLLHGAESVASDGELLYRIETALQPLRNLNTALVEQQMVEQILNNERGRLENDVVLTVDGIGQQLAQLGTRATAAVVKLRGGSVDRGHPVREAANKLQGIVSDRNELQRMRARQAGGNQSGLVPIGSAKQVGYITDEGRYRLLQDKMAVEERALQQKRLAEQQRLKQARSNLAGRSATDSFGGGYSAATGGKKMVVGAANSLEDMIKSARYELDRHKAKRSQEISSLTKGYVDDLDTRGRKLEELQRNGVESDPEYAKKEKALKDALEYLEEMQREEKEKAGHLLDGDLLGDAGGDGGGCGGGGGGARGNGGVDLLGFDNNSTHPTDVFGGATSSFGMPVNSVGGGGSGGGGTADLLGFDGFSSGNDGVLGPPGGAFSAQPVPVIPAIPVRGMGGNALQNTTNFESSAIDAAAGGGMMGNNNSFDMRPSLVTGMRSDAATDAGDPTVMGGLPSQQPPISTYSDLGDNVSAMGAMGGIRGTPIDLQPHLDEGAEEERSRKMEMAAGLFAGVVPNGASKTTPQRKPIMQSKNSSNMSALDELIPPSDEALLSSAASISSAYDSDKQKLSTLLPSDPFDLGPMEGSTNPSLPSSDPFEMGPMGGSSITGIPPPPPMAPPPPPTVPPPSMAPPPLPTESPPQPPPPPPMAPVMAPSGAPNNPLGANPSVEQMQEMIRQQQAQMNQMMQMMQQMQMQGPGANNNNGAGG